jgi:hypothetical protein
MVSVSELVDFPALRQVQKALWGSKEVRGAAVMVGAGFSKFARLASQDGRSPPLWSDFATEMRKRLDGDNLPNDPLGLAEQYGVALGRHALDALIRELVSDHQWTPGDLHSRLLGLPWADILTTNWDTLLERTPLQEPDRSYEVVRVMSDIARTRAPRIVKLHGSLPAHEPFIFTAEDFRTYPRRFAPFVNLAQQVLLENELCLIGFSGDDPNFLQWSGWVRDQLGASARKIRLVGVLNLSPSRRLVLEHHNISAIDLAPLVERFAPNEKHRRAMTMFIDSLWDAKPHPLHIWSRSRTRVAEQAKAKTAAESEAFLLPLCQKWRNERISYPGWLVAPYHERMMMRQDTISAESWRALSQATAETRANIAYELIWRCETSFAPIGGNLKALAADVLQHQGNGLSVLERDEIQLALLRAARRRRDWVEFDELARQLAQFDRSHIEPALAYERALRCRDEWDFEGLERAISAVEGDDPVWMIRRSALQCALGNDDQAAETLLRAWNEIKLRRAQDRESIWLLSREAWVAWLMRRARFTLSEKIHKSDEFERWPVKYKAADCDPWEETTYFDHEMSLEFDRRVKGSEMFQPRFDAGTYRDQSHSAGFGSDASLFDELAALADHVGLSDRIDHVDVLGTRFVRSLELVQRASDNAVWSAALHLPSTDGLIDRYFSRNAVARLPLGLVSTLAARLQQAIDYGRKRFTNLKWVGRTARHTELLSRLVVRVPAEDAQRIFSWAIDLSEDRQWVHWWLFEPLQNLLNRSLEAVPPAKRKELALAAIRLKLPKEVGCKGLEIRWPELAFQFRDEDYAARDESHAWSHRVAALIEAVRTEHNLNRCRAIWRLLAMHDAGALNETEKINFGEALWSQRAEPNGFPDHADLYGHVFLRLPEPQAGMAEQAFALKVVKTLCEGGINEFTLKSLCGSALDNKGKLIAAPLMVSDALAIFDKCLEWKPRNVEQPDFFGHDRQNNRDIGNNIGPCLSDAILPAIQADDLGSERTAKWIAALGDGSVESLVQTAPELAIKFPERKEDAISFIRRGLAGRADVAVYSAAMAVNRFIKYHAADTMVFPAALSGDIVAICSARRDPGLLMALNTARRLLNANLVGQEDVKRLVEALDLLLAETTYADWDDRDPRTRTLSLIRRDSVRLANGLKESGASGRGLDEWLSIAGNDAVPEVRFALLTNWMDG